MKKFFLFIVLFFFCTKSFCIQNFFLKDSVWNIRNKSNFFLYKKIIFKKYGYWINKKYINNFINFLHKNKFFKKNTFYLENNSKIFIYLYYKLLINKILIYNNKVLKYKEIFNILNKFNIKKEKKINSFLLLKLKNIFLKKYKILNKYNVKINFLIFYLNNKNYILKINFNEGKYLNVKKIFFKKNNYLIKNFFISKNYYFSNFLNFFVNFNLNNFIKDLNNIKNFYLNNGYLDFYIYKINFFFLNKNVLNICIDLKEGKRYKIYDLLIYNKDIKFDVSINKIKYKFYHENIYFKYNILRNIYLNIKNFFKEIGFPNININFDYQKISNNKIIVFLYIDLDRIFYINKVFLKNINLYEKKILYYNNIPIIKGSKYNEYLINLGKSNLEKTNFFSSVLLKFRKKKYNNLDIIYFLKKNYDSNINFGINYSENNFLNYKFNLFRKNFLHLGNNFLFQSIKNEFYNYNKIYIVNFINYLHNIYVKHELFYNNIYYDNDSNFLNYIYGYKSNIIWEINNFIKYKLGVNYIFNVFFLNSNLNKLKLNNLKYFNKNINFLYKNKYFLINDFLVTNNFIINKLDNIVLPIFGYYINFNNKFTFLNSDNNFYKTDIFWFKYISLTKNNDWMFLLRNYIGYGNSFGNKQLPFYESFDFLDNNYLRVLGQKNKFNKFNKDFLNIYKKKYYTNNLAFYFTNELIIPNTLFFNKYYSKYWRISLFLDSGFILNTKHLSKLNVINNSLKYIRNIFKISSGISCKFITPIGIINLSYGFPLLYNNNDEINNFQFNVGNYF